MIDQLRVENRFALAVSFFPCDPAIGLNRTCFRDGLAQSVAMRELNAAQPRERRSKQLDFGRCARPKRARFTQLANPGSQASRRTPKTRGGVAAALTIPVTYCAN